MKRHARHNMHTLAELIATVSQLAHNQHLGAYIVADMINSRKVHLGGEFQSRRVIFN